MDILSSATKQSFYLIRSRVICFGRSHLPKNIWISRMTASSMVSVDVRIVMIELV